jgi:nitrosocyanin
MSGKSVSVAAIVVALISLVVAGYAVSMLQSTDATLAQIESTQSVTYVGTTENFTIVNEYVDGVHQFVPSTIIVHEGDTINFKIKNTENMLHGFAIDAYGIHVFLQPNNTTTVSFVANKPGLSTFYCFLHPDHLHGELVVTYAPPTYPNLNSTIYPSTMHQSTQN